MAPIQLSTSMSVALLLIAAGSLLVHPQAEVPAGHRRKSSCATVSRELRTQTLDLLDKSRNRIIPVTLYSSTHIPVEQRAKSPKLKLAIFSPGYGMKSTDYSSVAAVLVEYGYLVASVQHEMPGDEPMPRTGKPSVVRLPNWERGVSNIRFVLQEIKKLRHDVDTRKLLLAGHSNGGDMVMLFAQMYPRRVATIISLDNRRMPLPRSRSPRILSIRSSDQPADDGVLPTHEERESFGMKIVGLENTKHDDMWDGGTREQRQQISKIISDFLEAH